MGAEELAQRKQRQKASQARRRRQRASQVEEGQQRLVTRRWVRWLTVEHDGKGSSVLLGVNVDDEVDGGWRCHRTGKVAGGERGKSNERRSGKWGVARWLRTRRRGMCDGFFKVMRNEDEGGFGVFVVWGRKRKQRCWRRMG